MQYFKLSQKEPFIKISLLHTTTDVIHLDGVNLHFQLFKKMSKEFFCKDIQSLELTFDQKLARKCKKYFFLYLPPKIWGLASFIMKVAIFVV